MDKDLIFDSVVFEAVNSEPTLSKADIRMLDNCTKRAYEIYTSKELKLIRARVLKLREFNDAHPDQTEAYCKDLIDRCQVLLDALEELEMDILHRGDSKSYNKNQKLQTIIRSIGTVLVMLTGSLFKLDIGSISAGVSGVSVYSALKDSEISEADRKIYQEYVKYRNKDPLEATRSCIASVRLIQKSLEEVIISK